MDIFWRGEPFLFHPIMVEGVRLANEMGFETGIVTNYYYIQPNWGKFSRIYTIQIGGVQKDIVLHEDEIK